MQHIRTVLQKISWLLLFAGIISGAAGCDFEQGQLVNPTLPVISRNVPRFSDNGNGTITDNVTGLIWLKEGSCFGGDTQPNTIMSVSMLSEGTCGLADGSKAGDWRLPHIKELLSLVDYGRYDPALPDAHPFVNIQSWYWASTPSSSFPGQGLLVNLVDGDTSDVNVGFGAATALPVRGTEVVRNARLVDNGNGTVTDMTTGLVWLKDADCFFIQTQPDALIMASALTDGMCGLTDKSKSGDWHLPTVQEIISLLDFSQPDVLLPPGYPFENLRTYYWSSTDLALHPGIAWNVYIATGDLGPGGDVGADPIEIPGFVLPVRTLR